MKVKAVLLLPPLQRETVILAECVVMSLEDIAKATAAEIGAVKSRLQRARAEFAGECWRPVFGRKVRLNATQRRSS